MVEIELFTKKQFSKIEKRGKRKTYGRVINLSVGLILGLLIDKVLFYTTKGLSAFIPPVAVFLRDYGYTFKTIRFDKDFGVFEKVISHVVVK